MQQLLHAALEHLGSALSTVIARLPNAGAAGSTAAAGGSAAAAAGCPVEALGQYFMDLVYLDAVLSKAGGALGVQQVCGCCDICIGSSPNSDQRLRRGSPCSF
jgi:hypothetical protein